MAVQDQDTRLQDAVASCVFSIIEWSETYSKNALLDDGVRAVGSDAGRACKAEVVYPRRDRSLV